MPRMKITPQLRLGMARMVVDILNTARRNAPYLNGDLRRSGEMKALRNLSWSVTFGNEKVHYAGVRERINHKNPQTRFYLKRAMETVAARAGTYFNIR